MLLLGLWASTVVAQTVTDEFAIPTAGSGPAGIVLGPDGNLWFTESLGNKIGRVTRAGVVTEFSVMTASSEPFGIAAGPDGNLWFTERTANKIGRITPAGVVNEFTVPTSGSSPTGIAAGPDGNLWFTEFAGNKIGKITPAGVITEFPLTTSSSTPGGITLGPDGALWFTERGAVKIGRITPAGTITNEFPIVLPSTAPIGITTASDGNLWFTQDAGTRIGRITPAGERADFAIPSSSNSPFGIAGGPDGNIWFTGTGTANEIVRITTQGVTSRFPVPTANSNPQGIAANNPDGALWFTENVGNKIGRITASACAPPAAPTNPSIAPIGNPNPNPPVTGIDFLNLAWSPPASGTSATSYDWAIGGDPFSAPTTATSATAPPRGSNSPITLRVRARGCAPEQPGPEATSATISPAPPVANFSASGPISAGASVTFTDTSGPQATSRLWLFGDGGSATTQSTTHTFANRGIYTVVLIASNGAGLSVKTNQQTVQSLRPLSLRAVPTRWFDSTDPGRRRLAGVRLAEGSPTWLRISAPEEEAEVIVYLRFLDEEGNLVEERRLSIAPGQDALYDLAAYGFKGTYSLELVSAQRFTPSLVQLTADDEDRGKRDRE